jgi:tripartite-type tricarboxylate transporter receptor subunit TctC
MNARTLLLSLLAGAALAAASPAVLSQAFPSKPVRIVSPYPSGITPDIAARVIAERLTKTWGQPVIVEPRPGANGFIAIGAAKKAAPDGHELLLAGQAHLAINPNLFASVPYDVEKDFVPLSLIYRTPFFIAVSTTGPYKSIPDLIAAAKASQKKLSYSSPYVGSPPHLGGALFAFLTGTQMLHVPFKDGAQIYISVANGDVDWALGSIGSTLPLTKAGKIKLLAVATKSRLPDYPDVPTVAEAGGPAGYEVDTWVSLVAPRGTPPELARRISSDIAAALADGAVRERYRGIGVDPVSNTPAQLAELVRTDLKVYGEIVKRTGVKAE